MKNKDVYQSPAIEVIVMEHQQGVMAGSIPLSGSGTTPYDSGDWNPTSASMKQSGNYEADVFELINDILTIED